MLKFCCFHLQPRKTATTPQASCWKALVKVEQWSLGKYLTSPSTTLTGLPSVQFVLNDVREMSNTADMKKNTLVTPLEVSQGCRYSTPQHSAPECHPQTPLPPCAACCHWCFWWFRPAQPVTSLQVSSHLKVLLSFHKNFSFSENSGHFSWMESFLNPFCIEFFQILINHRNKMDRRNGSSKYIYWIFKKRLLGIWGKYFLSIW